MVNILGTDQSDFLTYEGDILHMSGMLTNPYSGEVVFYDDDFNFSLSTYDGLGGNDFLIMSNVGDALFLVRNDVVAVKNVEVFVAGAGGDLVILADEVETYGPVTINGGDSDDVLWGNVGNDYLIGFDGNDHMVGGPGDDRILGGVGQDYLNGGVGADYLLGEVGDDLLVFSVDEINEQNLGISHDKYDGGEGVDILEMTDGDDYLQIEDDISPYHVNAFGQRISDIEIIESGAGDDVVDLDSDVYAYGNVTVFGGVGNDVIYSGAGDDVIYGGDNDPAIVIDKSFVDEISFPNLIEGQNIANLVPPGTPALGIANNNLQLDQDSTATITFRDGYAGYNNTLGIYRISDNGTISDVTILWNNVKDAGVDVAHQIDIASGSFGFFIVGNGDRVNGGYSGLDTENSDNVSFIYNYGESDERLATINDSAADVSLVYDDGIVDKGLCGKIYHTTDRDGDVSLNSDGQAHVVSGLIDGDANKFMIGFEDLYGTGDADYEDVVIELDINEQVVEQSETGDDYLSGGAGDDVIYGEAGSDTLVGGEGADTLYGGSDADIFVFNVLDGQVDQVMDFDIEEGDKILIEEILGDYDPLQDVLSDFLSFSVSGNGSFGNLNVVTSNGQEQIATIHGDFNIGMDIDDLVALQALEVI